MTRLLFFVVMLGFLAIVTKLPLEGAGNSDTPSSFDTITVNSTLDVMADDGQCTLREAITAANSDMPSGNQVGECVAGSGEDIISIPAGEFVLLLTGTLEDNNQTGDLDITDSVILRGAGANQTIINGNMIDRVLHIRAYHATIEDLTIMNGRGGHTYGNGGGLAYFAPTKDLGELKLRRVVVRDNSAGGYFGHGGGIFVDGGIFTLEQSEVSNNWAGGGGPGFGGGIYVLDAVKGSTLRLSTISGNHTLVDAQGGGIHLNTSDVFLTQMTITNNEVGTGTIVGGSGGGISTENSAPVQIQGSIIAGNRSYYRPNCYGDFQGEGGNIIGILADCNFVASPEDRVNIANVYLDILHTNGGGTRTHALLNYSPALDFGNCDGEMVDQRGEPRFADMPHIPNNMSSCDAGAFEAQTLPGTPVVTYTPTSVVTPSGTPTPTSTPVPSGTLIVNTTDDTIANDARCSLEPVRKKGEGG